MKYREIIAFIGILLSSVNIFGQEVSTVYGTITDSLGYNISFANVSIIGTKYGTTANLHGEYELQIPSGSNTIAITCIGYQIVKIPIIIEPNKKQKIDVIMPFSFEKLEEVKVSGRADIAGSIQRIDAKTLSDMPNSTGNIENVVKFLPGVASNNELSSQYSVRGGNFDENLVYVNDIEIFKPMLVRSGQQEGLSFVNPDLVGSLKFSAGGFDATYGDKMSSVLDITYKKPTQNAASFNASLLGGSGHFEGVSKNGKLKGLFGVRYKTSQYLLSTMDTKGQYNPQFTDIQTNLSYDITPKFEVSFLGNYSNNIYNFIPTDRVTQFGTFTNKIQFTVYYEGQEKDKFNNMMGAFTFNYHNADKYSLKLITTAYNTSESETFDILGQYNLSDIADTKSQNVDSSQIFAIGSSFNHARNFLDMNIYSVSHIGNMNFEKNKLKWGLTFQHEQVWNKLNEWDLIDSAGYATVLNPRFSNTNFSSNRLMGYVQNNLELHPANDKIYISSGIRAHYWSLNNQLVFNPRISVSYQPNYKPNLMLYFATGFYNQPAVYKELFDPQGNINKSIKAQEAIHFVLGADYLFYAFERPFKITTEAYYKLFDNLVPYKVDNVRTIYAGQNLAIGFARGIDCKINGELVKGTESWFSISLMQTQEKITKVDSLKSGYYPRPTDQLINLALYFQDYLPRNPSYKVHLSMHYSTGLPIAMPFSTKWNDIISSLPDYKRVDLGFSKQLLGTESNPDGFFKFVKDAWVGVEIFNLFDMNNVISYLWVKSVNLSGTGYGYYAVPNYLTSRRLNIKLSVNF